MAPGALFIMLEGPADFDTMPEAGVAFFVFFLVDLAFPIYFIFNKVNFF